VIRPAYRQAGWELSIIDRRWSKDAIIEPGSEMGELSDVCVKLLHGPSS
jgi:hypothetical protein